MLQNVIAGDSVRRCVVCHFLDSALTVFVTNRVEVQGGFLVGLGWFGGSKMACNDSA